MVAADLAEHILPAVQNEVAEVLFVQEGAALVCAEEEVRRVAVPGDACAQTLAHFTADAAVGGERVLVHVDLPADAAVVAAAAGDAGKLRVIVRICVLHFLTLLSI